MRISSTRNYQTAYGLEVDENTCAGVVGLSRISSILDNGEGRRNQKLAFGDFPFAPSLPPPTICRTLALACRMALLPCYAKSAPLPPNNKAGYTATEVACVWAGAIFEVTRSFGQEQ